MATLSNIMLEGSHKFNVHNFKTWNQQMLAIFECECLDIDFEKRNQE
jgi:hypothetical protein